MKKLVTVLAALAITAMIAVPAQARDKAERKTKKQEFTGKVTALDVEKNIVTLQKKETTKTFTCNADTKVELAKQQPGKLADIKLGDKVKIQYKLEGETAICQKLSISEKKVKKAAPDAPKAE